MPASNSREPSLQDAIDAWGEARDRAQEASLQQARISGTSPEAALASAAVADAWASVGRLGLDLYLIIQGDITP